MSEITTELLSHLFFDLSQIYFRAVHIWSSKLDLVLVKFIAYLKGYALCRRPLSDPRRCHLGGLVLPFWHPGGYSHIAARPTSLCGTLLGLVWRVIKHHYSYVAIVNLMRVPQLLDAN